MFDMLDMLLKQFAPDLDMAQLQGSIKQFGVMIAEMHAMQKETVVILKRLEERLTQADQASITDGKEHCNHDTGTRAGSSLGDSYSGERAEHAGISALING